MQVPSLLVLLSALTPHLIAISAFLTHESIRNLTVVTDEYRERITEIDGEGETIVQILGGGQVVLQNIRGDRRGDEVEEVGVKCSSSIYFPPPLPSLGCFRVRIEEERLVVR